MGASAGGDEKEEILEGLPLPVTIDKTITILDQMQNNICRIISKTGKGTGFFCHIPFKDKKLRALITSNHLINEKMIKQNITINLFLNDDQIEKNIELNEKRRIYTNKEYNVTIIEIKKQDKIKHFLELDENVFRSSPIIFNETGYIIQYPKILTDQKAAVSYGIIKEIDEYDIMHLCCTESGSSGAPILNLSNNKVIGIHRESSLQLKCNKGTFLKEPINEYLSRVSILNDEEIDDNDDSDDDENEENNNLVNKNGINRYAKKAGVNETKNGGKNTNDNKIKTGKNKVDNENKIKKKNEIKKKKNANKSNVIGGGGIKLQLKIEKGDINKEVYFLDNTHVFDENLIKHYHDYLGELNDSNVELFINEEKQKYQKFFTPTKEGTYNIRLVFKEKIEDCSYMFCNCHNLINVDLSSFETENIIDMTRMFYNCHNLTDIDLSTLETDNVTSMYSMFDQCYNLTNLNLSSFDTSNVEDFSKMFNGCKKLKNLDLSSFDSSSATNTSGMFNDCKNLKTVKINEDLYEKIKKEVDKKIEFIIC